MRICSRDDVELAAKIAMQDKSNRDANSLLACCREAARLDKGHQQQADAVESAVSVDQRDHRLVATNSAEVQASSSAQANNFSDMSGDSLKEEILSSLEGILSNTEAQPCCLISWLNFQPDEQDPLAKAVSNTFSTLLNGINSISIGAKTSVSASRSSPLSCLVK